MKKEGRKEGRRNVLEERRKGTMRKKEEGRGFGGKEK
jgi:hypothetical protein